MKTISGNDRGFLKIIALAGLGLMALACLVPQPAEARVVVKVRPKTVRIVVAPKPVLRVVIRPARPAEGRHVWIKGHYVTIPRGRTVWVTGHWKRVR